MYEFFEEILKQKGLKVADVCKATGIRSGVFSDWKMGRYTPKTDKLQKIADVLEVPLDYLMTGEMPKTYYINPETAKVAQEIFENKEMRILFDAAKDVPPEVLRSAAELLKRFKGIENG